MNEIDAGQRVKQFLEDEIIQGALLEVEAKIVLDWKGAKTPDEREKHHAEWRGLLRVLDQLKVVVNAGERAEHERDLAERRASAATH